MPPRSRTRNHIVAPANTVYKLVQVPGQEEGVRQIYPKLPSCLQCENCRKSRPKQSKRSRWARQKKQPEKVQWNCAQFMKKNYDIEVRYFLIYDNDWPKLLQILRGLEEQKKPLRARSIDYNILFQPGIVRIVEKMMDMGARYTDARVHQDTRASGHVPDMGTHRKAEFVIQEHKKFREGEPFMAYEDLEKLLNED